MTVKLTLITWGGLAAPREKRVIVPLYVPPLRADEPTEIWGVAGVVPDAGEALNQEALLTAVHASVPPPPPVS